MSDWREFTETFARAKVAGIQAGEDYNPTPMVVGQAKGLTSNEIDYSKKTYYVPDGPCGFAWVNVKPGTSRFARWLKQVGHARTDSYYGGVTIWISEHNQSIERKEAHAKALCEVLKEAFPELRIYWSSRLD